MRANRLVIGLDYGTTYTGVSFCEVSGTSNSDDKIQIVQNWPSAHTMIGTKEKVPSEIAYSADGVRWGGLIPPQIRRHMWTKLALDRPQPGIAEQIAQELESFDIHDCGGFKSPTDIVADFLKHVKEHLVSNLDSQYGSGLWKTLPMTLVVTVPAVWSDAAKDRTMRAVTKAGFNTAELPQLKRTVTCTEPEAAALYTINTLRGTITDDDLTVDDGFVVCDMGGGTVDLISYRVASVEPTSVQEATIGTGGQCGGSFVDRGFLTWLERKIGASTFKDVFGCRATDIPHTSLPSKLGRMVQDFSLTAKSGFLETEEYWLRLPAPLSAIEDDERGMCDGEIRITATDLEEIFAYSLQRTQELLVEQFRQAERNKALNMKYVFMVGGFAESPYMYRKISALSKKHGIRTIKPVHAWSAIARGATVKGMEGDGRDPIKFRKCRRHYGTAVSEVFVPGRHHETDSYICPYSGIKRARKQMSWLLTKGQDLSTEETVHAKIELYTDNWHNEGKKVWTRLMASDVNKAAARVNQNVYQVAELTVDLSNVPRHLWKQRQSPQGRPYQELEIEVHMTLHSALDFSVVVQSQKYGAVSAAYD